MAETKEKTITRAGSDKPATKKTAPASGKPTTQAKPVGNSAGLRAGAIILWLLAIGFEVLAVLFISGKLNLLPKNPQILWIPALVLDLICVIIGSQLWKKANHIKPASKKNPALFWLWNNMGLIATCLAFVPFVILTLKNKDLDKKTKTIATIVALIALLIGGACSYDYNPVSQEDKDAAVLNITSDVYWSAYGKVYHVNDDCQALSNSSSLTVGTVEEAIAANRTRLCSFCAKKNNITDVVTDDAD